jgi:hypothetical protein
LTRFRRHVRRRHVASRASVSRTHLPESKCDQPDPPSAQSPSHRHPGGGHDASASEGRPRSPSSPVAVRGPPRRARVLTQLVLTHSLPRNLGDDPAGGGWSRQMLRLKFLWFARRMGRRGEEHGLVHRARRRESGRRLVGRSAIGSVRRRRRLPSRSFQKFPELGSNPPNRSRPRRRTRRHHPPARAQLCRHHPSAPSAPSHSSRTMASISSGNARWTSNAVPSAPLVANPAHRSCKSSKYAGNHPLLVHSPKYSFAPSLELGSRFVILKMSSRACTSSTWFSCDVGLCVPRRNASSCDRSNRAAPSRKSSPRTHPSEKTSADSVTPRVALLVLYTSD